MTYRDTGLLIMALGLVAFALTFVQRKPKGVECLRCGARFQLRAWELGCETLLCDACDEAREEELNRERWPS